jgi:hypothetical protein
MDLNKYSERIYNYLQLNNFDLIENIKTEKSDFCGNHIRVELKPINENSINPLFLSTEDNLLTVGFHNFHSHFYEDNDIDKAIETFYKIKNEEYLVVNLGLLKRVDVENLKNGKLVDGIIRSTINFYVTSWSGKYDSKFENKNYLNPYKKNYY